ncbi:MAG: MFS transporter [Magnetospirillum sp. WYHS-4]
MASDIAARAAALDLLAAVLDRHRPLDESLDSHRGLAALSTRDRGFARLLVATVLRRLGQIDALIAGCLDKPLPAKAAGARDILRLGVAQLLFLDVPAHAALDTSVRLTAGDARLGGFKALINAVLRRLQREGAALIAGQDAPCLNTPDWLWDSWVATYGEETTRHIADAHLAEAPLDITAKGDPAAWAAKLEADILPTGSLRRTAGGAVQDLPGFAEGAWWVQDAAAALPVRLLGDVAGRAVIDLCAAPGGKTAQLAAAGARVTAIDRSAPRLLRVRENLDRLHLDADLVAADGETWRPAAPADAVLLDAPCSATGTIRRHPDVARLKRPEDVAKMAQAQARLLAAAVEMVKPGGMIVYCSCSLQPDEGPAHLVPHLPVERVRLRAEEVGGRYELLTPAGDLRTLPSQGMDGFFAVRLRRL